MWELNGFTLGQGKTALMIAASFGNLRAMRALFRSPLYAASRCAYHDDIQKNESTRSKEQ